MFTWIKWFYKWLIQNKLTHIAKYCTIGTNEFQTFIKFNYFGIHSEFQDTIPDKNVLLQITKRQADLPQL